MGLGQCKNHEHFINKLLAQAKQWLMQMKSTLGHKLALDSLHSHGPNLEGGKYLPSYNIYYIVIAMEVTSKWPKFQGFPSYESHNFVSS